MWFKTLFKAVKDPDLRRKILFVLGIFVVFRIMANIPMPGIDVEKLREFFLRNQVFGLMNLFTGGALSKFSLVMLGLGPYITAVIVLQLLTMIFPSLEEMYKEEGEAGRAKFNQYGRILTVPFAILQSYAMLVLFERQGLIPKVSLLSLFASVMAVTAGTVFLMWLGELITEKGIGNGISLLIFAGIVARFPTNIREMIVTFQSTQILSYILFFISSLIIVAGVIYITEARRNLPISYTKRVRGMKMYGGVSTYLPININPAGVIPIIFALSLLLFPGMIGSMLGTSSNATLAHFGKSLALWFKNPLVNETLYFFLVFVFTYFYTAIVFDPKAISENLQRMGAFIPGIRPGKMTADYLQYIINRILVVGGAFLGTVAILPYIIQDITGIKQFSFLIGGTSLLIIVSVVLETMKRIKAQLKMREYEAY